MYWPGESSGREKNFRRSMVASYSVPPLLFANRRKGTSPSWSVFRVLVALAKGFFLAVIPQDTVDVEDEADWGACWFSARIGEIEYEFETSLHEHLCDCDILYVVLLLLPFLPLIFGVVFGSAILFLLGSFLNFLNFLVRGY